MEVSGRPTPGSVIAEDYVIEGPLAEGGMGAVYIARQRSTGRRRALKVMHPQLVRDPKNRERFLAEARVSAGIRSAHVVEIIGAGVDPLTSTPWLAMELLDGETLQQRLDRTGVIHPRELAEMFAQIGEALGAAHDVGVVHRDLKPDNLYLTRDSSARFGWSLKILDFGIAKVLQDLRASATATAQLGTPLYMAPEQAESTGRVRAATDVWAVGLIAFYALVGKPYWLAANTPDAGITALMKELLFDPIPSASVRAANYGAREAIPAEFDGWFAQCVAREATERFVHGRVACEVLSNLLRDAAGTSHIHLSPPPTRGDNTANTHRDTHRGASPSSNSPSSSSPGASGPRSSGAPSESNPSIRLNSANMQPNSVYVAPQYAQHTPPQLGQAAYVNPYAQTAVAPAQRSGGIANWAILAGVAVVVVGVAGYEIFQAVRPAQDPTDETVELSANNPQASTVWPTPVIDSGIMAVNAAPMQPVALQPAGEVVERGASAGSAPSRQTASQPTPLPPVMPGSASGRTGIVPQAPGRTFSISPVNQGKCTIPLHTTCWAVEPIYSSSEASDRDARRAGCRAAYASTLATMRRDPSAIANLPAATRAIVEQSQIEMEREGGPGFWCCP